MEGRQWTVLYEWLGPLEEEALLLSGERIFLT